MCLFRATKRFKCKHQLLIVVLVIKFSTIICDTKFSKSIFSLGKALKIIHEVNNQLGSPWTAGKNFDDDVDVRDLLGSIEMNEEMSKNHGAIALASIPITGNSELKEFDSRKSWPHCPSIGKVKNQGRCAADWVLAPIATITDRLCIANNKTSDKFILSAHEPLSCCKTCGWGCKKGYPQIVYKQFVKKGLATGGDYNSKQPYEIKPCLYHKKCSNRNTVIKTPTCKAYCYNKHYKKSYKKDKTKGKLWYSIPCYWTAGEDMINYGPIIGSMVVYEDFITYKSAIGKKLGRVTVKLIGFNDKTNPRYWIGVNSWGKNWGENGTFKIVRGHGDCMIDRALYGVSVINNDE